MSDDVDVASPPVLAVEDAAVTSGGGRTLRARKRRKLDGNDEQQSRVDIPADSDDEQVETDDDSSSGGAVKKPRWTADEDGHLVRLVKEGVGWRDISTSLKEHFDRDRGEAGCAMRWYNHLRKHHTLDTAPTTSTSNVPLANTTTTTTVTATTTSSSHNTEPSTRRNRRWTGPSTQLLLDAVRRVERETATRVSNFRLGDHWDRVAQHLERAERDKGIIRPDEKARERVGCRERYNKVGPITVTVNEAAPLQDGSQGSGLEDEDDQDGVSSLLQAAAAVVLPAELREHVPPPPLPPARQVRGRKSTRQSQLEDDKTPTGRPKKLHICPVGECGATFKRAEHLKRHWRGVHLNDKPFACDHPGCDKKFTRRDNLQQHMQMVHRYFGPASTLLREPGPTHADVVVPTPTPRADVTPPAAATAATAIDEEHALLDPALDAAAIDQHEYARQIAAQAEAEDLHHLYSEPHHHHHHHHHHDRVDDDEAHEHAEHDWAGALLDPSLAHASAAAHHHTDSANMSDLEAQLAAHAQPSHEDSFDSVIHHHRHHTSHHHHHHQQHDHHDHHDASPDVHHDKRELEPEQIEGEKEEGEFLKELDELTNDAQHP